MAIDLFSMNIRTPHIRDTRVLEVLGAGINELFDNHKKLNIDIDDAMAMDHAKLTMGDHTSELCTNETDFEYLYNNAIEGLEFVLAAQSDDLKSFAQQLKSVDDITNLEYPGLIRMYVWEERYQRWK